HLVDGRTHPRDAFRHREGVHVVGDGRPRIFEDVGRAPRGSEGLLLRGLVEMADARYRRELPEVLFVCVHNAGRSQMAAALLAHHSGGRVMVRSAGSTPADEIDPAVVQAMAEVGLDISGEVPKGLTDQSVRGADAVVTMGCRDACPVYPGKRYLDWDLPDPAGKS